MVRFSYFCNDVSCLLHNRCPSSPGDTFRHKSRQHYHNHHMYHCIFSHSLLHRTHRDKLKQAKVCLYFLLCVWFFFCNAMDLYDYVNIYVRVLHRRPVYPGLHPSKQVPLTLLHIEELLQCPQMSTHSSPYVPFSQAFKGENITITFNLM